MNNPLRYRSWISGVCVTLGIVIGLIACSKPVTEDSDAKNADTEERKLHLETIRVHDATPENRRINALLAPIRTSLEQTLWSEKSFARAKPSDPNACKAEFVFIYALLFNGEPVQEAQTAELRMAMQGQIHCPHQGSVETYRVEVIEKKSWQAPKRERGEKAFKALGRELAQRTAEALFGQTIARHAKTEKLLQILASEQREGMVMEAAIEAGERKLSNAVPDLIRLTRHPRSVVAMRAAAALGLIRSQQPEVLKALVAMIAGNDLERHVVAINALADVGGARAVKYLETLADGHPEASIRTLARHAKERAATH